MAEEKPASRDSRIVASAFLAENPSPSQAELAALLDTLKANADVKASDDPTFSPKALREWQAAQRSGDGRSTPQSFQKVTKDMKAGDFEPGSMLDHQLVRDVLFVRKPGRLTGAWTFSNSRMGVETLVCMHRGGASVETLHELYPTFSTEMISAALDLPNVVGEPRWLAGICSAEAQSDFARRTFEVMNETARAAADDSILVTKHKETDHGSEEERASEDDGGRAAALGQRGDQRDPAREGRPDSSSGGRRGDRGTPRQVTDSPAGEPAGRAPASAEAPPGHDDAQEAMMGRGESERQLRDPRPASTQSTWRERALLAEKSCHELNSRVNELRGLCDNLEKRAEEAERASASAPISPEVEARNVATRKMSEASLSFFSLAINLAQDKVPWNASVDFAEALAAALGIIYQGPPRQPDSAKLAAAMAELETEHPIVSVLRASTWMAEGGDFDGAERNMRLWIDNRRSASACPHCGKVPT